MFLSLIQDHSLCLLFRTIPPLFLIQDPEPGAGTARSPWAVIGSSRAIAAILWFVIGPPRTIAAIIWHVIGPPRAMAAILMCVTGSPGVMAAILLLGLGPSGEIARNYLVRHWAF